MKVIVLMLVSLLTLLAISTLAAEREDHKVATQLAIIRAATAKYHDVEKAKADGYIQISQMAPDMGYHFRNPKLKGTELDKPHMLLYVRDTSGNWQLVGAEWTYPKGERPSNFPLQGEWNIHSAACHYKDATEIREPVEAKCPSKNKAGGELAYWHPDLETFHAYVWVPHPDGLKGVFSVRNPFLTPFNPKPTEPGHVAR